MAASGRWHGWRLGHSKGATAGKLRLSRHIAPTHRWPSRNLSSSERSDTLGAIGSKAAKGTGASLLGGASRGAGLTDEQREQLRRGELASPLQLEPGDVLMEVLAEDRRSARGVEFRNDTVADHDEDGAARDDSDAAASSGDRFTPRREKIAAHRRYLTHGDVGPGTVYERQRMSAKARLANAEEAAFTYRLPEEARRQREHDARARARMRDHDVIENRIQEAIAAGAFDELPGAGRPLTREENPFEAIAGEELSHRVLRAYGAAPPWVERQKDIRRELHEAHVALARCWLDIRSSAPPPPPAESSAADAELSSDAATEILERAAAEAGDDPSGAEAAVTGAAWSEARGDFDAALALLNRRIQTHNLGLPSVVAHMLPLRTERELARALALAPQQLEHMRERGRSRSRARSAGGAASTSIDFGVLRAARPEVPSVAGIAASADFGFFTSAAGSGIPSVAAALASLPWPFASTAPARAHSTRAAEIARGGPRRRLSFVSAPWSSAKAAASSGTPYEILGVGRGASEAEIRAAYLARAAEAHPDRSDGDEARFVAVGAAYETLRCPTRRRALDVALDAGLDAAAGGGDTVIMDSVAVLEAADYALSLARSGRVGAAAQILLRECADHPAEARSGVVSAAAAVLRECGRWPAAGPKAPRYLDASALIAMVRRHGVLDGAGCVAWFRASSAVGDVAESMRAVRHAESNGFELSVEMEATARQVRLFAARNRSET